MSATASERSAAASWEKARELSSPRRAVACLAGVRCATGLVRRHLAAHNPPGQAATGSAAVQFATAQRGTATDSDRPTGRRRCRDPSRRGPQPDRGKSWCRSRPGWHGPPGAGSADPAPPVTRPAVAAGLVEQCRGALVAPQSPEVRTIARPAAPAQPRAVQCASPLRARYRVPGGWGETFVNPGPCRWGWQLLPDWPTAHRRALQSAAIRWPVVRTAQTRSASPGRDRPASPASGPLLDRRSARSARLAWRAGAEAAWSARARNGRRSRSRLGHGGRRRSGGRPAPVRPRRGSGSSRSRHPRQNPVRHRASSRGGRGRASGRQEGDRSGARGQTSGPEPDSGRRRPCS
jgi:hypothetical protein